MGNRIAELRAAAGVTQAGLAASLGVDRTTVTKWETGQSMPRADMLPKVARLLGCSIERLYGGDDGAHDADQ